MKRFCSYTLTLFKLLYWSLGGTRRLSTHLIKAAYNKNLLMPLIRLLQTRKTEYMYFPKRFLPCSPINSLNHFLHFTLWKTFQTAYLRFILLIIPLNHTSHPAKIKVNRKRIRNFQHLFPPAVCGIHHLQSIHCANEEQAKAMGKWNFSTENGSIPCLGDLSRRKCFYFGVG